MMSDGGCAADAARARSHHALGGGWRVDAGEFAASLSGSHPFGCHEARQSAFGAELLWRGARSGADRDPPKTRGLAPGIRRTQSGGTRLRPVTNATHGRPRDGVTDAESRIARRGARSRMRGHGCEVVDARSWMRGHGCEVMGARSSNEVIERGHRTRSSSEVAGRRAAPRCELLRPLELRRRRLGRSAK